MPGVDVLNVSASENTHDHSLLKAHKVLPRRRDSSPSLHLPTADSARRETTPRLRISSAGTSRRVTTVTPTVARTAVTSPGLTPSLPLTPPSNCHEAFLGDSDPPTRRTKRTSQSPEDIGVTTPINQRSPPTPDITPPSVQSDATVQLRPMLPNPSSRAESFRTAREHQWSSDEEGLTSGPSSPVVARQKWLDATRPARLRDIGLGLGLELDEEGETTPTAQQPGKPVAASDFVTFDGAWVSDREEEHGLSGRDRKLDLAKADTMENPARQESTISPQDLSSIGAGNDTSATTPSLTRGLSLRDRIRNNRHSLASSSTERFAEQIGWPLMPDDVSLDNQFDVDKRRFSAMSGTSTIVEALVVDTPPQRRQTLRHTGKNLALRSSSSPIQQSSRGSVKSNEQTPRLARRNVKLPERGDRNSFASETSVNAASSAAKERRKRYSFASETSTGTTLEIARHRRESIPVLVIPERRTSLSSSAESSRRNSACLSLSSGRKQLQSNAGRDEAEGYFDIPRQQSRTHSESQPSSANSRSERRKGRDFAPIIPRRSSSLSAPTSRNPSRATSLTSTSLKLRDAVHHQGLNLSQPPSQLPQPPERLVVHPDRTGGGEWCSLRPQAALITPFSQHSIQSSTPGTLEVSEATAVSIYPHNNRSILIVQQRARRDSGQLAVSEIAPEQIDDTPEWMDDDHLNHHAIGMSRAQVDSPLKNPREPPKPPEFKVIPPTPAVLTPVNEVNRQLGMRPSTSDGSQNTVGPLSLVKRALSNRRYSESFVSPFTRSLSRKTTATNPRPSVSKDTDSKLHPFWRPRGFWDDFSDSDSDFGNDGFMISNTLGLRQRSAASGPMTLARRLTGLSASRRTESTGVRRKKSYGSLRNEHLQRDKSLHGGPNLGLPMQFTAWKSLQDRLEKRKAEREEARRERQRAKLRKSIGAMIVQPDARVA